MAVLRMLHDKKSGALAWACAVDDGVPEDITLVLVWNDAMQGVNLGWTCAACLADCSTVDDSRGGIEIHSRYPTASDILHSVPGYLR